MFLGSSERLVTVKWISLTSPGPLSQITLTTCSSTPSSDQKGPLRPRVPWLCLGAYSPPAWSFSRPLQGHQELPLPGAGCLLCPGEASMVVRCKSQQVPVGPPTRSIAASTRLLPSSLWMGPGCVQGHTPHCVSWYSISSQCCLRGSC